jgi:hypothetical protein
MNEGRLTIPETSDPALREPSGGWSRTTLFV